MGMPEPRHRPVEGKTSVASTGLEARIHNTPSRSAWRQ